MPFKIYIAKPRGFCAGVERAIEILDLALKKFGPPVYVRHAIVHNEKVVKEFEKKGAIFVEDISEIPEGSIVVFSAHGVSPKVREEALKRNLKIIDATCPLVTKVHLEARYFAKHNYLILLIGHKNHVEVEGTMGEAPENIIIIEKIEDLKKIEGKKFEKIAILTQTTLSVDDTRELIAEIQRKFKNAVKPKAEDICYATQNRQDMVKKIAPFVDLFLIVGSKKSSNSNRLKEIAEKNGTKAYLINDKSEIPFKKLKKISTVGITSGASTPEYLVQEIIEELKKHGAEEVIEIKGVEEDIKFSLPPELGV
ncbi:MAG: 4-hydroxy-3-methylbut-2-enyl diphosphate reductase [Candidatus Hydrothermales bacterium]